MTHQTSDGVRRTNLRAFAVCLLALALALAALFLPMYEFSTSVFTKKSGNTFVGDEKYIAVRAEVEDEARRYAEARGGAMPEIVESVTERTNSKGETTSMVAFTVKDTMRRSGWDFIRSGLPGGRVLTALTLCAIAAVLLLGAGLFGAADTAWEKLPTPRRALRRCGCWLALVALGLLPVFLMNNTLSFSREVKLAVDGMARPGFEALLRRLDGFLYGCGAGEDALNLISGLSYGPLGTVWMP